jgi:hypothetical protein
MALQVSINILVALVADRADESDIQAQEELVSKEVNQLHLELAALRAKVAALEKDNQNIECVAANAIRIAQERTLKLAQAQALLDSI